VYDLVVIRSTWDYWSAPATFLDVLADIDRQTRLANPLALVRWNLSKTYLGDLETKGVTIVPSLWRDRLTLADLAEALDRFDGEALVVKPQVGGNGEGVWRIGRELAGPAVEKALAHLGSTPCLVQPYRPAVTREGEVSLFWLGGRFSHAIRKRPAPGEFRSQEERGARIESIEADPSLLAAGERAMAALRASALYARIDLIRHPERGQELVELELVEPSLYFRTDAAAPGRFARAVDAWCAAAPGPGVG
jgi:hypothetical protein